MDTGPAFEDRRDAGRRLARALGAYRGRQEAVVLAIPRGGVVIGAEIARGLGLPLGVVFAKKIGHPEMPGFAIGAVDLEAFAVDEAVLRRDRIPRDYLEREIRSIREELRGRLRAYGRENQGRDLRGSTVILADDGIATGLTMAAALRLVRLKGAARIVVAVPVSSRAALENLERVADEVVCLLKPPDPFFAISRFYGSFSPVEDEEAIRLLSRARR